MQISDTYIRIYIGNLLSDDQRVVDEARAGLNDFLRSLLQQNSYNRARLITKLQEESYTAIGNHLEQQYGFLRGIFIGDGKIDPEIDQKGFEAAVTADQQRFNSALHAQIIEIQNAWRPEIEERLDEIIRGSPRENAADDALPRNVSFSRQ